MRPGGLRLTCAVLAGASLLHIHMALILSLASQGTVLPHSPIEGLVFSTLLLRLLLIAASPRLRTAPPEVVFILVSMENLLLPPLALLYIATGHPWYVGLIRETFYAWPAATAILLPPYAIWRLARSMYGDGPPASILPTTSLLWGSLLYLLRQTQGGGAPGPGLSGLTQLLLEGVRGGPTGPPTPEPAIQWAGLSLYLALILAAALHQAGGATGELDRLLLLLLAGTSLTLIPLGLSILYSTPIFFAATLPAIAIALLIRWLAREG